MKCIGDGTIVNQIKRVNNHQRIYLKGFFLDMAWCEVFEVCLKKENQKDYSWTGLIVNV